MHRSHYISIMKYKDFHLASTKASELVPIRDVRWPKFVGTGMKRNAFPFKKDLSLSNFFSFFLFFGKGLSTLSNLLWISNPVFRHSFPVFLYFHLSKPVPCFLMGLNLAI